MSLDDRNAELNKQLEVNPIDKTIDTLLKADQRNRRHILLLTLSLIFDLVLSVVLAFGWHNNHNLAIRAETNRDAIIRNCETSNESRAKNKQLWTYILNLPPSNGQTVTPDQQKRIDNFKVFVDDTFAQRDCKAEINKQ
jgi:hypothetical protein